MGGPQSSFRDGDEGNAKRQEVIEFEWKIAEFFSVSEKEHLISSPCYSFANSSWYLRLYFKTKANPDFMYLHLCNKQRYIRPVTYNLGFKKLDSSIEPLGNGIFKSGCISVECLIKLSKIQKRKSDLVPSGVFTITCKLIREIGDFVFDLENMAYAPKPKKTKNEKQSQDFKEVCLGVQNPDLILKIGEKEIPAHRDILRTRSPVFESMLCRNIKRKTRKTTFIDIPDCDPTAMEQLLLYVYCGKVDTLDKNNMLGLYYAADKYHMEDLKIECCSFIKKSLSCSNVCGVSKLAFNHSDSGLIEHVTNYFCDNSQNILSTAEWHSFMKDNCATANELLKKSFDKLKNVKE